MKSISGSFKTQLAGVFSPTRSFAYGGSARNFAEALHEALHEALRTEVLHKALRTEALHEALRRLCTKLCTKFYVWRLCMKLCIRRLYAQLLSISLPSLFKGSLYRSFSKLIFWLYFNNLLSVVKNQGQISRITYPIKTIYLL